MIFFNLKKAESLLKRGNYSNGFVFNYFLISSILIVLSTFANLSNNEEWKLVLEITMVVLMNLLGLVFLYRINEKGDQKNFLERYFVLNFIVSIRVIVFFTLFLIVFLIIAYVAEKIIEVESFSKYDLFGEFWFDFSLEILITVIIYILIGRSFKRVAQIES